MNLHSRHQIQCTSGVVYVYAKRSQSTHAHNNYYNDEFTHACSGPSRFLNTTGACTLACIIIIPLRKSSITCCLWSLWCSGNYNGTKNSWSSYSITKINHFGIQEYPVIQRGDPWHWILWQSVSSKVWQPHLCRQNHPRNSIWSATNSTWAWA